MAARNLQKMFYFSSDRRKNFIEEVLQRKAEQENCSISALIESAILDSVLPENKQARYILEYRLVGEHAVRDALEALFSWNSGGLNWRSVYINFKPFVEFAIENCKNTGPLLKKDGHMTHFFSQFESIVHRIEALSTYCIEPNEKIHYVSQAKLARTMYEQGLENARNINYKDLLVLVNDCWDMLYDWTFTYRFLADISELNVNGWNESSSAKNELYHLIVEQSKDWKEENRADQIRL